MNTVHLLVLLCERIELAVEWMPDLRNNADIIFYEKKMTRITTIANKKIKCSLHIFGTVFQISLLVKLNKLSFL